jgi:hypothetical protein
VRGSGLPAAKDRKHRVTHPPRPTVVRSVSTVA